MSKPSGFIFYRGPSMLDGKPIVGILTGLGRKSKNEKTGAMLQTWILRADMSPVDAIRKGHDVSICGDCKARGTVAKHKGKLKNSGRVCYVEVAKAPAGIYKAFKRGVYQTLTPQEGNALMLASGRKARGGSYGDPAAIPFYVWEALLQGMESGTAYTHQWRNYPELASFAMASVDNANERAQAKLLGFRTFRVRGENEPIGEREVSCPASEEAGFKTTCALCVACGGNRAKAKVDMTIVVHANRDAQFAAAQLH